MSLSSDQIVNQSKTALKQWGAQWEKHAKEHKEKHPKDILKSIDDFSNIGVGSAVLLIANGYSFEKNAETIRSLQENVDIMVCDKTLGSALDNGITPDFALVCDANVNYEKYMEKWKDKLDKTVLFQNVCANPKWADNGNWKDRYFFVNADVIKSEEKWTAISGCKNVIPAGTNVSNAMVVFCTQSDNTQRRNFFGYDKILLIGFDYSWTPDGSYYAFDRDGGGKAQYMRHQYVRNIAGQLAFTSNNLVFSAKWLEKYVGVFKLPVMQCSKESLFPTSKMGVLSEQMLYSFRKEDSKVVRRIVQERDKALESIRNFDKVLQSISREHFRASMAT